MTSTKSKTVAGILGIFLGGWGAHNFYLGYTKKAILQCILQGASFILGMICYILAALLSVVVIGIIFLPIGFLFTAVQFGVLIWGTVEGIMILCKANPTDANGYVLTN